MITSLQNPLVKRIRGLQQPKTRRQEGVFLIEGEKELTHAAAARIELEMVVYCETLLAGNACLNTPDALRQWLHSLGQPVPLVAVTPPVYEKIAYRETVEGLVGLARTPQMALEDLALSPTAFVLVVEGVEKPGNLGALLRTADAAGVEAVLVCDAHLDLYNPNVVRASVGALFTVQTIAVPSDQARPWLQAHGIHIVAACPAAPRDYRDVDYRRPVAIALGNEKQGLSTQWRTDDLCQVKIPMRGAMDSLNLSCSGAILMYEVDRQRRQMKT